jgi:PKD repeat protein
VNRLSRIGLLAVVIAAGCLTGAVGAAEAKEPTPPPPITVPPSTGDAVPPADAIVPSHQWAVCSGWYQSSTFGGRWATDGSWWEYNCPLTGMVDESSALWTDYYYWDGSGSVYYGEWWTEPYDYWFGNPSCSWWRDPADNWYGPYACPQETNAYPAASYTYSCSGLHCTFDGTGSSDADGMITSHLWYFGDGSDGIYGATPEHVFARSGTYYVSLSVTDDGGLTDYRSQAVTVWSGAPTARFGVSCAGLSCSFDGASSTDENGTIVSFGWEFGDGNGTTGPGTTAAHRYSQAGTYPVSLTVTDDSGETATTSRDAVATNAPPTVAFAISCSGLSCTFDGGASTDIDGTIERRQWTLGDGTDASGVSVEHTYARAESYSISLTVTDDGGATASQSKVIGLISLSARGYKASGVQKVDLTWNGASGMKFDVYRNSATIATADGGSHTDTVTKGSGAYTYKVCGVGSAVCSNAATVRFP